MKQTIGPYVISYLESAYGEGGWAYEDLTMDTDEEAVVTPKNRVFVLAHDLMEHVNGLDNIGSYEDELMAMGAAYYMRAQYGVLDPHNNNLRGMSLDEKIASTIGGLAGRITINTGAVDLRYLINLEVDIPTEFDENIECIVNESRNTAEAKLEHEDADMQADYNSVVSKYAQTGFNIAEERYGTKDLGHTLFVALCDQLRDALKYLEDGLERVIVTIAWDIETHEYGVLATIEHIDLDDESDTYDDWVSERECSINKEFVIGEAS